MAETISISINAFQPHTGPPGSSSGLRPDVERVHYVVVMVGVAFGIILGLLQAYHSGWFIPGKKDDSPTEGKEAACKVVMARVRWKLICRDLDPGSTVEVQITGPGGGHLFVEPAELQVSRTGHIKQSSSRRLSQAMDQMRPGVHFLSVSGVSADGETFRRNKRIKVASH